MRIMRFIQRTINTRITPLAYLFAVWMANFGINIWWSDRKGGGVTLLSQIDALIPSEIWGLALGLAALVLIVGMLMKHKIAVQISAFAGFILWAMAGISYVLQGYIVLHGVGAVLLMLMWGYYFLAAGLDQLWDYSPERLE